MPEKVCKRCLLAELADQITEETIRDYIAVIDPELKVEEPVYQARLRECSNCDHLINATCDLCGCFVEVRAVRRNQRCPNVNDRRWEQDDQSQ